MAVFYLFGGGHFEFFIIKIHLGLTLILGFQIYYEVSMLHDSWI